MRPALLPLLLVCLLPSLAGAAGPTRAELVRQGERLYSQGEYEAAAETLERAWALEPHPLLLYNIARAYDQAGQLEPALHYYQRYVNTQDGADATLVRRSRLSIDRINGLLTQRAQAQAEQARLAERAAREHRRAEEEAEAKRLAEEALRARQSVDDEAAARSRARVASYLTGGLSVAAAGSAVYFGLTARALKNEFTQAPTSGSKTTYERRTRQAALLSDGSVGLCAALLVTALALHPREPDSSFALFLGPAGGAIEVRF